ncbi:hypothetical protein L1F30_07925 [Simiduia sp. 21SJ11W-1]|uniref:hypothetical protein n=1 Tax=Simiduia sp. 21SJ11W-1 TaxID=2909669 RepID=UPI00209C7129|nr:hypothetical protein [Simiduia sp. 21SJ11W-1]UTA49452.1 hypothetical protein L1F30_07925 [Simiduia sp. 21SJ11W-1]
MKLPFSAQISAALAVFILALPSLANAQSLSALQTALSKKESALTTLNNRIESYAQRQVDAEEKLQEALADLGSATAELDAATRSNATNAQTLQTLAAKKVELAKNALESRQSRLNSAREKYTALLVEKQTTEAEIKAFSSVIAQRQRDAQAQAKAKAEAQRQAAIIAAQNTSITTATPAPAVPQPQIAASTAQSAEPKPVAEEVPPTPRQLHAQKMMDELNARVKGADKEGWRRYESLTLRVDRGDLLEFEYLGNHQYYAEVELEKGKRRIKIRSRTFAVEVPDDEHGHTFVVIYDTRDKYKAEFSIFNKSLLD